MVTHCGYLALQRLHLYSCYGDQGLLTTPAPASTLTGTSTSFAWAAGIGASEYFLSVGYSAGASDVSSQSVGTALSASVTGLPTDGRTVYVRLWSKLSTWVYNDYTYTAATVSAGIKAVIVCGRSVSTESLIVKASGAVNSKARTNFRTPTSGS